MSQFSLCWALFVNTSCRHEPVPFALSSVCHCLSTHSVVPRQLVAECFASIPPCARARHCAAPLYRVLRRRAPPWLAGSRVGLDHCSSRIQAGAAEPVLDPPCFLFHSTHAAASPSQVGLWCLPFRLRLPTVPPSPNSLLGIRYRWP